MSISFRRTKPTCAVDHGTCTDALIFMMTLSFITLTIFSHSAATECAQKCHGCQSVVRTTMDETVKVHQFSGCFLFAYVDRKFPQA